MLYEDAVRGCCTRILLCCLPYALERFMVLECLNALCCGDVTGCLLSHADKARRLHTRGSFW